MQLEIGNHAKATKRYTNWGRPSLQLSHGIVKETTKLVLKKNTIQLDSTVTYNTIYPKESSKLHLKLTINLSNIQHPLNKIWRTQDHKNIIIQAETLKSTHQPQESFKQEATRTKGIYSNDTKCTKIKA